MHHGSIANDTVEGRIFLWLKENPGWHSSLEIQNSCNTIAASTFMASINVQLTASNEWTLERDREGSHGIYRVVKKSGQLSLQV